MKRVVVGPPPIIFTHSGSARFINPYLFTVTERRKFLRLHLLWIFPLHSFFFLIDVTPNQISQKHFKGIKNICLYP